MMMRHKLLYLSFLLLLIGVGRAAAQSSWAGGDLRNFTYEPSCASEDSAKPVTVKDGEYSYEKQEDGYIDHFYFKVFDVIYGDLTGDGKAEAVALTVCNTGGTGNFTEGFIFGVQNGRTVQLAILPGGDRAYGGIRKVWIETGRLVVETNDPGELGGACCPTEIITSTYKLAGKTLNEVVASTKRAIYPSRRVAFAKGKSEAVIKLTVRGDEGAELVVRANKGQTMTVTTDNKSVETNFDSESKMTSLDNGFRAVLADSGDQKIRLDNQLSSVVTVTIKITVN